MTEMHLRQPQFTYSACGPFTKHKERIQNFKETGDTNYIYKNELDKACFAHDAAYSDSKGLTKRSIAHKILKNKAFNIRKNIFACLFSVHNTISLSRHEQVCLMRLRFERYFSHHRAM